MSWEAFRLTSKSPSELLAVMGPAGVDGLVRDALMACWRSLPEDSRSMPAWRDRASKLWTRNMKVWSAIKKPTPQAFFVDLAPFESDGHFRQALVMTWMMLPRAGGREFRETMKIIRAIFDRNIASWESDHRTFTAGGGKRAKPGKSGPRKPIGKSAARKPKTPRRRR